jgi:hypothetical protein
MSRRARRSSLKVLWFDARIARLFHSTVREVQVTTSTLGSHVTPQPELASRLDRYLAPQGASQEMLLDAIGEALGSPLLVVASGSIIHGLGNKNSDIDLIIIVEGEVSRLPILCCASTVLIDARYFPASAVRDWPASFRSSTWPQAQHLSPHEWNHRQRQLLNCSRLGEGCLLTARDGWQNWLEEFHEAWVVRQICDWWAVESLRWRLTGQWLGESKPMLAAHCYLEAALASLEARAAAGGRCFFGRKWLQEKLKVLDDREGLDNLRAVLTVPTRERDVPDFITTCEGVRERFLPSRPTDWIVQLWYRPDVRVLELHGQTLVSRANIRGLEFEGRDRLPLQTDSPIWQAPVGERPPADVLALFNGDMTWMSIVTTS